MVRFVIIGFLLVACVPVEDSQLVLVSDPQSLVLKIIEWEANWDKANLKNAIYGMKIGSLDTGELMVRGIMGHKEAGAFAYSPLSFRLIGTKYGNSIRPLTADEFEEFFPEGQRLASDSFLATLAENHRTPDLKIFRKVFDADGLIVTLLFVRHENTWKIVYSHEATLINE